MNNVIDTTGVIGRGEYIWRHQAEAGQSGRWGVRCSIASVEQIGTVYVIDHDQKLAGIMTADSVRDAIISDLEEAQALAWEAEQGSDDCSDSRNIAAGIEAAKTAAIAVDSITSPRTGRRGWRVTYTRKGGKA